MRQHQSRQTIWLKLILSALLVLPQLAFAVAPLDITFRLGEDDAGAVVSGAGAATTVSTGTSMLSLNKVGLPTYVLGSTGSGLAMQLDGIGMGYSAGIALPSVTNNNFGMEVTVKATTAGSCGGANGALFYAGNSGSSGYGLYCIGGNYQVLFGGLVILGSSPVTTQWTKLSLIRVNGVSTFYVNGVAAATSATAPNVPVAGVGIGKNALFASEFFGGQIDNARFYAFTPVVAASATGSGNIAAFFTGGGATCDYTKSVYIPVSGGAGSPPAGTAPAGVTFTHGLFDFALGGCTAGSTVTFTITYPSPVAQTGAQYWKYGPTPSNPAATWYTLPSAVFSGNTVTFTVTDGGLGDDDLMANGVIVDQGGPGFVALSIPTLSQWSLMLLAAFMLLLVVLQTRREGRDIKV